MRRMLRRSNRRLSRIAVHQSACYRGNRLGVLLQYSSKVYVGNQSAHLNAHS